MQLANDPLIRFLSLQVHLSSMSVYSNWPGSNVSVDYVYSTDFSSDSRYMVLGNAKGKAPLFRSVN